ncbi:MAG TPA: FAD-binding oxidoreductase [Longimicrobiales bacterium]|nr:FAD-binding oxidoreductase [Longimicrobiales bacterium]
MKLPFSPGVGPGAPPAAARRIEPPPAQDDPRDAVRDDGWGFADTAFGLTAEGHITVTGGRYAGLSGEVLPNLLPWFRRVIAVDFPLDSPDGAYPPPVDAPRSADRFFAALDGVLAEDQVSTDPVVRLRRGHGHTVAEMDAVRSDGFVRVPDYVVFPTTEGQVGALVDAAGEHGVVLVPYGGGTNVTEALRCLPDEERPIVAVDMGRMNRIEWIDPVDRMACIQAGATGRHIQAQLAEHGFTMGHEPDSLEFSTLGGWIATNASGMKKNRYGNIEDLVLDVSVATPAGVLSRSQVAPRESVGIDPRLWMIGSEGTLGIITSAVVKLFPLPQEQRYGSLLFRSFEEGLGFMYELAQQDRPPASVRLMDNLQFQFGQALKPVTGGRAKKLKSRAEKWLVTGPLGFDPDHMVAVTLVFEGTREEVVRQERDVYRLAKRHRGFRGGADNGRRGYMLTFGIAYIRDFVLQHGIVGESFETSVPWSRAAELIERVNARVLTAHRARGLPGRPFFSCRVTQLYETGCCIYFYMAFYGGGVPNAVGIYHEIEVEAREEVLAAGGSISHHHGVGKLRLPFVPGIMSPASIEWRARLKAALDPDGVFAAQSPLPSERPVTADAS